MLFAEMLDSVKTWATELSPIAVGGFVAGSVLTFLALTFMAINVLTRRRELDPAKLATAAAAPLTTVEKALSWAPPEQQSYADRRGAVRREGQPVRVVLASTTFRNGSGDGYVIDRSTGGLKLATQVAVAPGTPIQVRAHDAPDTVGFVTIIVRTCRNNTDYFELGCEFEKTPPWNVLLLFG
jgi:hypothetical protein